ncbi:uncharacterized protein [Haliotis asinina]|uniref:uncharacterized protein n=1 Tax=Haliotis asinina TaxID=109174 RepID=UPI00353205E0
MLKKLLYTRVLVVAALVVVTDAACDLQALSDCTTGLTNSIGVNTATTCRAFKIYTECILGVEGCAGSAFINDRVAEVLRQQGIDLRAMCTGVTFNVPTTTTTTTGDEGTTRAAAVHCDTNEMYECSNTVVAAVDGANGDASIICTAAEVYAQCLKKQTCKTSPIYLQALVTITSRNLDKTCPNVVFTDPTTTATTPTAAGSTPQASTDHCDVNEMYDCSAAVVAAVDAPNATTNTICAAADVYVKCLNNQTCKTNSVYLQALRTITAKNLDRTCPDVVFPTTDSAGTVRGGVICILALLLTLLVR